MKVSFPALVPQTREVYVETEDFSKLALAMEEAFLFYMEFNDFRRNRSLTSWEPLVEDLCSKYEVNIKNTDERLAFFKSLIQSLHTLQQ